MPNPTWVLTTPDTESLRRRLAALPHAPARGLSGKLGYRGLVVEVTNGAETRFVRIQSGNVHIAEGETTTFARDEGRELERWLIETGRPQLSENVMEVVEREMR